MKRHCPYPVMLGLVIFLVSVRPAIAYEVETHRRMSDLASRRSSSNETLTEALGLSRGLNEEIARRSLLNWLAEGSVKEDRIARYLNHFHNPTADSWLGAGFGGNFGQSAILWGQNADQEFPSWSWLNVRQYYLDALTARRKGDRDQALADTFEGLGRLIHLIQDVASPAHTRNDPHKAYNYESYVRDVQLDPRPGRIRSGVHGGSNVRATSTCSTPGTRSTALRTHSGMRSCTGQPGAVSVMVTATASPAIRTP